MRYLCFDIECCDGQHICEFGYVITDENLAVQKKGILLINPREKFRLTGRRDGRDISLHFEEEQYNAAEEFDRHYDKILQLITYRPQTIIGFSCKNDKMFLKTACQRYDKSEINYFAIDLQAYVKRLWRGGRMSLEALADELKVVRDDCLIHKSDDDAEITMRCMRALCEREGCSIDELIKKCNKDDFGFFLDDIVDAPQRVSKNERRQGLAVFLERVKPTTKTENAWVAGKKFCLSKIYEQNRTKDCMVLIQMLIDAGGRYVQKVSECDCYVTCAEDSEDDKKNRRYSAALRYIATGDLEAVRYDEFLRRLGITDSELISMKLPQYLYKRK